MVSPFELELAALAATPSFLTAVGDLGRRFSGFFEFKPRESSTYMTSLGIKLILKTAVMVSGDLLVEARRRAGISQAELGRRSGVPPSLIGRYERYEVIPSLERLRSLLNAAAFDLSFRLAKTDETNHDQVLIERELRRTPGERFRRGLSAGRQLSVIAGRRGRV